MDTDDFRVYDTNVVWLLWAGDIDESNNCNK